MILWRELKLLVTPSTHSLEDHILTQINFLYIAVLLIKQGIIQKEGIQLVNIFNKNINVQLISHNHRLHK